MLHMFLCRLTTHFLTVPSSSPLTRSRSSTAPCVDFRSCSSLRLAFSTSARTFFSRSKLSSIWEWIQNAWCVRYSFHSPRYTLLPFLFKVQRILTSTVQHFSKMTAENSWYCFYCGRRRVAVAWYQMIFSCSSYVFSMPICDYPKHTNTYLVKRWLEFLLQFVQVVAFLFLPGEVFHGFLVSLVHSLLVLAQPCDLLVHLGHLVLKRLDLGISGVLLLFRLRRERTYLYNWLISRVLLLFRLRRERTYLYNWLLSRVLLLFRLRRERTYLYNWLISRVLLLFRLRRERTYLYNWLISRVLLLFRLRRERTYLYN